MNTGVQRVLVNPAAAQKRSKIPRSQGCSREASPSRLSVGKNHQITLSFFIVLLTLSAGYLQLVFSYRWMKKIECIPECGCFLRLVFDTQDSFKLKLKFEVFLVRML